MSRALIAVLLILLCVPNAFLLSALARSSKGETSREAKLGLRFISSVLVLDFLFSIGGVILW